MKKGKKNLKDFLRVSDQKLFTSNDPRVLLAILRKIFILNEANNVQAHLSKCFEFTLKG